jgi:hypothetical protein
MPTDTDDEVLTLGDVARRHGLPTWKVRRVFERKFLAEPKRVGNYRVVRVGELPALAEALRQAGYLREQTAAAK